MGGMMVRWASGALRASRAAALLVGALVVAACSGGDDSGGSAGSTTSTRAGAEGEILALTYNVAGLPEGMSDSNPSVNTPLISPLLNDYDLVLVQEDWLEPDPNPFEGSVDLYHDLLAGDADHPYQSEPMPIPLGEDPDRPTALVSDGLNRFSRSPFGEITRVRWETCFGDAEVGAADCLALKGFSVATHTFADGVEVDVYNLHAEAGGTPEDQTAQAADYVQLAAFINEHSEGRAIILGGDTNLHTGEDADPDDADDARIWRDFLEATGLSDVCDVVDCGDDVGVIDKFAFRSGGGVQIEPLSHDFEREKFRRDDGEPLSDHDALAVRFRWSAG